MVRQVGDVTLTDHGPRVGIERYVIDFGEIVETTEGSFILADLPQERLCLGIEVKGGESFGLLDSDKPDIGTVRLELKKTSGELVFLEKGPLQKWRWTLKLSNEPDWAFIYNNTHFTPKPGESYQLNVSTSLTPEALRTYRFRLLAHGGGWQ